MLGLNVPPVHSSVFCFTFFFSTSCHIHFCFYFLHLLLYCNLFGFHFLSYSVLHLGFCLPARAAIDSQSLCSALSRLYLRFLSVFSSLFKVLIQSKLAGFSVLLPVLLLPRVTLFPVFVGFAVCCNKSTS